MITTHEKRLHDKKFLQHLNPSKGSMLVFDKAYNHYRQFADWTEEGVYFVCRLKDNAKVEVQEVLFEKLLEKDEYGVSRIEHIHLISHLDLMWVVAEGRRAYTKRRISRNKSPATAQMSLF